MKRLKSSVIMVSIQCRDETGCVKIKPTMNKQCVGNNSSKLGTLKISACETIWVSKRGEELISEVLVCDYRGRNIEALGKLWR